MKNVKMVRYLFLFLFSFLAYIATGQAPVTDAGQLPPHLIKISSGYFGQMLGIKDYGDGDSLFGLVPVYVLDSSTMKISGKTVLTSGNFTTWDGDTSATNELISSTSFSGGVYTVNDAGGSYATDFTSYFHSEISSSGNYKGLKEVDATTVGLDLSILGQPLVITGTDRFAAYDPEGVANVTITWDSIVGAMRDSIVGVANGDKGDIDVTGNGDVWTIDTAAVDLSGVKVTGVLPIGSGGTGLSALGTAGQLLQVNTGATALEYFTPNYLSGSGNDDEIAYFSGGSIVSSSNVYIDGTLLGTKGNVIKQDGFTSIIRPQGGSGSISGTGLIEITLPGSTAYNGRIKIVIEVLDYGGKSSTIIAYGGLFTIPEWYSVTVDQLGNNVLRTRFGKDASGTNAKIWIGEITTVWSAAFVSIKEIHLQSTDQSIIDELKDGLSVALVTSVETVKYDITRGATATQLSGDVLSSGTIETQEYFIGAITQNHTSSVMTFTPKTSYSYHGTITGAIDITLPDGQIWYNSIEIVIFNYSTNTSTKIFVSGYWSYSNWFRTSAYSYGQNIDRYTIRFGYVSGVPHLYIGETTTTWQHLSVYINKCNADIVLSSISEYDIINNWSITTTTTLGTVGKTHSNTLVHSSKLIADAGSETAPTSTFTNDTNTGIFSPATDNIAFSTAGLERLRINETGNVGIGITSPATKLHVVGETTAEGVLTVKGSGTSSTASEIKWQNTIGGTWSSIVNDAGNYALYNPSSQDVMYIRPAGQFTITGGDNMTSSFKLESQDGATYIQLITTDGAENLRLGYPVASSWTTINSGLSVKYDGSHNSNFTASAGDYVLDVDATTAAVTVTLPATPNNGQVYIVIKKDSSANAVIIDGNGKNINGSATLTLASQYDRATILFTGADWRIID